MARGGTAADVTNMDKVGMSVREEYVEFDRARIWTATQGQGTEALVLLHGGPGGFDELQPVADMVDDLVRVHRYEQRGSGRSTGGPPYTVERWLDDLERLRAHWTHPQWIVFGHSFGAELALAYAAAFSPRVRAIIYMSCLPAVVAGMRGEEEFRANRAARIAQPLQARFIELCRLRDEGGEHWTPALASEFSRICLAADVGSLPVPLPRFDRKNEPAGIPEFLGTAFSGRSQSLAVAASPCRAVPSLHILGALEAGDVQSGA